PNLMIRFDHFIPAKVQKHLQIRWDAIIASGAQHNGGKRDANHSATDAFHFGIWEVSSALPHLTADTSTSHQSPEAITVIDTLLQYIGDFVAPKIGSVFKQHTPTHWEAMQKAYERVKHILASDLLDRPSLDLGGNFFSVAVKEGGSGLVHLDWNNSKVIWCFVFAVGNWEGWEFCTPQLGIKIPIQPGQVFAVLAHMVAHFSAPVTNGHRIVFTCFTDKLAFSHANPNFVIG
ncbi:uncharacterized protein EDB91DRAFT_1063976, partial [Suillus paluster]|uniref:uncharacterized protein n=1 Tax=Suillus paluster TaxID=48578 RepID=UPI001B87C5E9